MFDRLRRTIIEFIVALVVLSFVMGALRHRAAHTTRWDHAAPNVHPSVLLVCIAVLFSVGIMMRAWRAIRSNGWKNNGRPRQVAGDQWAKRASADHVPAPRRGRSGRQAR
jgi:hypothetical protein